MVLLKPPTWGTNHHAWVWGIDQWKAGCVDASASLWLGRMNRANLGGGVSIKLDRFSKFGVLKPGIMGKLCYEFTPSSQYTVWEHTLTTNLGQATIWLRNRWQGCAKRPCQACGRAGSWDTYEGPLFADAILRQGSCLIDGQSSCVIAVYFWGCSFLLLLKWPNVVTSHPTTSREVSLSLFGIHALTMNGQPWTSSPAIALKISQETLLLKVKPPSAFFDGFWLILMDSDPFWLILI